ncbi:hypothetical protein CER18_09770, partial [Bartonella tribocorum]
AWTAPSFKVKTIKDDGNAGEGDYASVSEAFEGVGTSFTNLHQELNKAINQVVDDSLVKQEDTTKVIKIGAEKEGTEITVANSEGIARSISGVKAATKDDEAVNKMQLDQSLEALSKDLQSEDSAVVLYDKADGKTDYTNVTLGKGKDSSPVGLHNVADGKIVQNSHDAITGGQINTIGENIAKFLGGESAFKDGG